MASERRRAAFIDRDGVINEELGYVHKAAGFCLLPGVIEGLFRLQQAGYLLIVITNQAGISRGMYSEGDFQEVTSHMQRMLAESGVTIVAVYFCPHHPDGVVPGLAISCDCRKPAPGMLLKAAAEWRIGMAESVLVGDKISDVVAGRAAGVGRNILVRSGHHFGKDAAALADDVCDDLAAAARLIVPMAQP